MGIIEAANRITESADHRAQLGEFFKCARLLAQARGRRSEAQQLAVITNATPRVQQIMKAAVSAGVLSTNIADYQQLTTAFYRSLRQASVFDAVLPAMTPAPLRSRGAIITTGVTGAVVGENMIKPISNLVLDSKLNEPRKASAIVVATRELVDCGRWGWRRDGWSGPLFRTRQEKFGARP
jgi:hypothetical protein